MVLYTPKHIFAFIQDAVFPSLAHNHKFKEGQTARYLHPVYILRKDKIQSFCLKINSLREREKILHP